MNKQILLHFIFTTSLLLSFLACSPDIDTQEEENIPEAPDTYHDRIREHPYPKHDNEIFLNPPPFIVPEKMSTDKKVQFSLSRSKDFDHPSTTITTPVAWNIYNPHRSLEHGTWYWRFRPVSESGVAGEWSETYNFEIKQETPCFVTPDFRTFFNNLPHGHPRLFCFLDQYLNTARQNVTRHREYRQLTGRANSAMIYDYIQHPNLYDFSVTEVTKMHIDHLYLAYHLTQNKAYQQKMLEVLRMMLSTPVSDAQLFASNFGSTNIAIIYIQVYDIAFDLLTTTERTAAEELMLRIARYYYKMYCGMEENRFFDNHFWQQNMRILFQIAFVLYDKYAYAREAAEMMEYYYELWTARAPDAGYNLSGIWKNGVGYFTANVKTLYYMPSLFSWATGSDFLKHPWYQNAGRAMVYTWPPQSGSASFGDGSEKWSEPDRQRVAFADFLAKETNDPYAAWYARECDATLVNDLDLRLYRMTSPKSYSQTHLPEDAPKLLWHKDAGEVSIHSNLADRDNNLSISFRSSPFGAGSHTIADQNSFVLLYRGKHIFRNGGYFVGDNNKPYNLLWYRHTRSQNSVLVNGIGQPYSLTGYGRMLRAAGGEHIGYCLGDASKAYNGISEEKAWVDMFRSAGIAQIPENGFGKTPLKKFFRHIVTIYPHTILIYDELEADEPVRWDWLLHSPVRFTIEADEKVLTTLNVEKDFVTRIHQFSDEKPFYTQTTETTVPLTTTPNPQYPDLWHLKASFASTDRVRLLSIIQVTTGNNRAEPINRIGNRFTIGNWNVEIQMDAHKPASIHITNKEVPVVFNYGTGNVSLNGEQYQRKYNNSSVLYDNVNGEYYIQEIKDYLPASSRAALQEDNH